MPNAVNENDEDKYIEFKVKQFHKQMIKIVVLPNSLIAGFVLVLFSYSNITQAQSILTQYYPYDLILLCLLPILIVLSSSYLVFFHTAHNTINFYTKLEEEVIKNSKRE